MKQAPISRESGTSRNMLVDRTAVQVTAASRLHFGLMGFQQSQRPFGGVGMMIDQPQTVVRVSTDDNLAKHGPDSERIMGLVACWADYHGRAIPDDCVIELLHQAPAHIGLGSGTQSALAVVRALNAFYGVDKNEPEQLVTCAQRAQRSSVGSWGFHRGGFIVELGHEPGRQLAPDHRRAAVPEAWRVMLAWPPRARGLHGTAEQAAFTSMAQIPAATTARLERLALDSLLPALEAGDFRAFSEDLLAYGALSGNCFSSIQGGPYGSVRTAELIEHIRSLGVTGVGQSSWGPVVFALLPDEASGCWLRQQLQIWDSAKGLRVSLVRPANYGAQLKSGTS